MRSKSPFGPGSIDTKVSNWLNQHEKFPFICWETAPWVGLPAWLCLWLRILFLFGRAEPKIAISTTTTPMVLWQTRERNSHLQWRLPSCITQEMKTPGVFLSSAQLFGFWAFGLFVLKPLSLHRLYWRREDLAVRTKMRVMGAMSESERVEPLCTPTLRRIIRQAAEPALGLNNSISL